MNNASITPTGESQRFDVQETFFSMTDGHGVITDGNAVFARVSGYPLERMRGANHNLIRHPGVPRAVFHLLWATVKGGATFMGYVKNLAANANHYWVMAVVMPVGDGFLSVRIKPTSSRLAQVESIYAEVLATENRLIAEGLSEGAAAATGAEHLLRRLAEAGWPDYAAFSHESLILEIKQRDAQAAARGLRLFPETLPAAAGPALGALHDLSRSTYARLNEIFAKLDHFLHGSAAVAKHQQVVAEIGDAFSLNAFNAHLAAHPLGASGVVIGTVARFLNEHARELNRLMSALTRHIAATAGAVSDIASNVCAARIQMEMILSFLAEMVTTEDAGPGAGARVRHLREACRATTHAAARAIGTVLERLPLLREDREQLRKTLVALQSTQITGITEAARLGVGGDLQLLFRDMRAQVERTKDELDGLGESIADLFRLTRGTPEAVAALQASVDRLSALPV